MSPSKRLEVARAFWLDQEAADDQIQALFLIAERKKFRAKSVAALDIDRKARHLASIVALPESLAGRALITYHLAEQRPMMAAFLDSLGIAHENGLIQDDAIKPEDEKLGPAAARLAEQFPPENVSLYLSTLLCQDPATWGGLASVPEAQAAQAEASPADA